MLLFAAIAIAILWISGCALGLALCAMAARSEGREPARRARRAHAPDDRFAAADRLLPTA
jgi:hypothetical protein